MEPISPPYQSSRDCSQLFTGVPFACCVHSIFRGNDIIGDVAEQVACHVDEVELLFHLDMLSENDASFFVCIL